MLCQQSHAASDLQYPAWGERFEAQNGTVEPFLHLAVSERLLRVAAMPTSKIEPHFSADGLVSLIKDKLPLFYALFPLIDTCRFIGLFEPSEPRTT